MPVAFAADFAVVVLGAIAVAVLFAAWKWLDMRRRRRARRDGPDIY